MTSTLARKLLYKFSWDTRCRSLDTTRVISSLVDAETEILDAGCGEYGLSAFMQTNRVTGVDILPVNAVSNEMNYVHGSIVDLPFENGSFDVVASVDVLEHLPEDMRPKALNQLVRVARRAVVVAFPYGSLGRRIDEDFADELRSKGQDLPEWLAEHLSYQYPVIASVTDHIEQEARKLGRSVTTRVQYSENSNVARFLRHSSIRSRYVYVATNLLLGIFYGLLAGATETNAYRAIIVSEFD